MGDRPDEVFEGRVSSTPPVELLKRRSSKARTISGPRMMYLDDAMIRGALHTQAMDAFLAGRVPATYRHMHAFYGVLCIRKGDFVAVRAAKGFHMAGPEERCYRIGGGYDNVLNQTVFHLFQPQELCLDLAAGEVAIADHVPDIEALSNDYY